MVTNRLRLGGALGVAVVAAGVGFWPRGDAEPIAPRRHEVEIRSFVYEPERLEVQRGDTVVWLNRDIVAHTATTDGWTTGEIRTDSADWIVVEEPGEYEYTCILHPTMKGLLVVAP